MAKVLVLVEGQTEETFVRQVLEPHLRPFHVSPVAKLLVTKRLKSGAQFKGGVRSFDHVHGDILRLLNDTSAAMVTTMIDYYGVLPDFPGYKTLPGGSDPYAKVQHLEAALAAKVGNARFFPYFSLHEYEAIIFSDPARCEGLIEDASAIKRLIAIRRAHATPEHINDGPTTAPSKRIIKEYPAYDKVYHGTLAADAIGLATIRAACAHFGAWVQAMEKVGE